MYSKTTLNTINKRPCEESASQRQRKLPFGAAKVKEAKQFMFRILLPDGSTLELKMPGDQNEIPIEDFIDFIEKKYFTVVKQPKRQINWNFQDIHFTDTSGKKINLKLNLLEFKLNKWHFLQLHDGLPEPDTYEDMWDLTPDTDLLKELPHEYTYETALADLVDNSLQALWSGDKSDTKLISVELLGHKIVIFDSGPGMDGSDGNLLKWGKMGASSHRSDREKAIGGSPPYLVPFFGMFGYGGPVATMCLGRRAVVSSKTKKCKKVFTLHLERDALIAASHLENCWRTKGGIRDPTEDEKKNSPHQSFTKVEIFEPKMKIGDLKHFLCKLKDIYFPYIQCDEISGKTSRPVKFQVNGVDLAGIRGGEVATTNLHSCNGPDFILQLHFSVSQDSSSVFCQSKRVSMEANARLKFVYFPKIKGEESIKRILDRLDANDYVIGENYETFSRVSLRRLGRLLPDLRWASLPFMEPKLRVGEKAKMMMRHYSRVKCFIETDAGFDPTTHKTDLAQHHPYTKALRSFGNMVSENEDVQIEISKDGSKVTLPQLQKLYYEWVSEMHEKYDEEVDHGLDKPTIVICPSPIKKLCLSSLVLRVHKKIQRRGICWEAGQRIKVLKGACAGCHNKNVYATLDLIVLEGLQGESSGEGRLICRTLGQPDDKCCQIVEGQGCNQGSATIDIKESLVCPIRIIDSEKCVPVDDTEWDNRWKMHCQKLPSAIELLSDGDCQELELDGGMLPDIVKAGDDLPENIVAVIRPKSFSSGNCSKRLDQKFIFKSDAIMTLKVIRSVDETAQEPVYGLSISPSSHERLNGLYIIPLKSRPDLFDKAGYYTFLFSLNEFEGVNFQQVLQVQASADAGQWKVVSHKQDPYTVRVGSFFDRVSIVCSDKYDNKLKFMNIPKLTVKLSSNDRILAHVHTMEGILTADKSTMIIKGIVIETNKLDNIRPDYKAALNISSLDEAFSVALSCCVLPGTPHRVITCPQNLKRKLIPGEIIEKLAFEVFDEYGNHAKEGESILLSVDGFLYEDRSGLLEDGTTCLKKVDSEGCVDLSNVLKVSKGYGKNVCLDVSSKEKVIYKLRFQTEMRELRTVSKVFKKCEAGSYLENIVFEVVNSEGVVDESVNHDEKAGRSHTLTIKSHTLDIDDSIQYTFRHGRCTIRSIPLPHCEGVFFFSSAHSRYVELSLDIEVHVENVLDENQENLWSPGDVWHSMFSSHHSCDNPLALMQESPYKAFKSSHESHTPNGIAVSATQSPKTPKVVQATRSPMTPEENAWLVCQSLRIPKKNIVHDSHSPSNPPIETSVPFSYSPKTLKFDVSGPQDKISDILPSRAPSALDQGDLGTSGFSQEKLEDNLIKCNKKVTDWQSKLETLSRTIKDLKIASDLQDRRGNGSSPHGRQFVLEKIKSKSQSASAVICKLYEETPSELRHQGLLGIVALLGAVESVELSSMLAQYLGDDLMRTVVCKNYAAAKSLETKTVHQFATRPGKFTSEGYYVLCLEDISPINSEPSTNPQDLLPLQLPRKQDGSIPQGFLGYAVNMITLEPTVAQWRTDTGHGLRETLFYRLFGDVQVYDKRSRMMRAQFCIKGGAISLDGGILRGNGLVSFGEWEPYIIFPVPKNKDISVHVEIVRVTREIDEAQKAIEMAMQEFLEAKERYNKFCLR